MTLWTVLINCASLFCARALSIFVFSLASRASALSIRTDAVITHCDRCNGGNGRERRGVHRSRCAHRGYRGFLGAAFHLSLRRRRHQMVASSVRAEAHTDGSRYFADNYTSFPPPIRSQPIPRPTGRVQRFRPSFPLNASSAHGPPSQREGAFAPNDCRIPARDQPLCSLSSRQKKRSRSLSQATFPSSATPSRSSTPWASTRARGTCSRSGPPPPRPSPRASRSSTGTASSSRTHPR